MTPSTRGAVATGDSQSAEAGARALRAGGNAVDAAVGAAFAAFVCELPLCSPLGGGVLVSRTATGSRTARSFFAMTPGLGLETVDRAELDFHDVEISFGETTQAFHIGRGSAAVPLALPGIIEAHRREGSLPLTEVTRPAIELAKDGYVLSPEVARIFEILEPIAAFSRGTRAIYFDDDGLGRGGSTLANPDLANVLDVVSKDPREARGLYSQLVREFGPAEGGLVTAADVSAIEVGEAPPVSVHVGPWRLSTMSNPSSGGVLIALGARLLEGVGGRHAFSSVGHYAELVWVQKVLANLRDEGFDERCRDPSFIERLLDDDVVQRLRSLEARGEAPPNPLGSTTHISAVDESGAAVGMTLTNGEGCGHVLAGTGIHVNNLLGEEDINPRGFHADPPGTSMATMMSPTVLERADTDAIVLGSGGSNRLRNAILQTTIALTEFASTPEAAVAAPRLHVELARREGGGLAHAVAFERGDLEARVIEVLTKAAPHEPIIFERPSMFFGGVHVAVRHGGDFTGAGDARRGGAVVVVS